MFPDAELKPESCHVAYAKYLIETGRSTLRIAGELQVIFVYC
jgi:hypothetical protein